MNAGKMTIPDEMKGSPEKDSKNLVNKNNELAKKEIARRRRPTVLGTGSTGSESTESLMCREPGFTCSGPGWGYREPRLHGVCTPSQIMDRLPHESATVGMLNEICTAL